MNEVILLNILTGLTSIMTITFMYFNGSKKRWAWLISLAGQPLWVVVILMTQTYMLFLLNSVMVVLAIRGYIKWGKENKRGN